MKIVKSSELEFIPASHEDPTKPGSLKKVLFKKADFTPGRLQMINWSLLPVGREFSKHYHEDMEEVFIIISGDAIIDIDGESCNLHPGDAVFIPACARHVMKNSGSEALIYIALGVASGQDGKTVVV